jgi:hypothetical protein
MISQTLLILGVILISVGFARMYYTRDNSKVIYRYIPRTFKEDQDNPPALGDIYGTMFYGIEPREGIYYEEIIRKARQTN